MTIKDKLFCKFYLSLQNPQEAAVKAGYAKHIAEKKAHKLLNKQEIQNEIKKLKTELDNNQLIHWAIVILKRIIFCTPNDTIKLALKQNNLTDLQLEQLNLFLISEFKKSKDGSLEIKFIDKLKALACLTEISSNIKNSSAANTLLNALNNVSSTTEEDHKQSTVKPNPLKKP